MRFLADMGVSQRVVEWLRGQGHDATHLRDQGLHRMPDEEIFLKASAENRVILTFDLDFAEIVALSGSRTVSVVIFRLKNTTTQFVIGRLDRTLSLDADALHQGAIIVVEDGRHRVRRLPLGS